MFADLFDVRYFLLYFFIFCPLEYLFPAHHSKKILRPGFLTDVIHFFFSGLLIKLGLFFVLLVSLQIGNHLINQGLREWVEGLSLWVQVPTIILIADLGFYLSHRLMHSVPFLWKFHAVHHSSEQLDWLAAFRVHPLDQVLVKGLSLLPIFAFGFSTVAIGISQLIYQWQAMLIHSNINFRLPYLRWLLATPEFHHWHHSNMPETYNKNYSGQLPLWDLIFGTANMTTQLPSLYGIQEEMPKKYHQQLFYPFISLRERWTGEKSETESRPEKISSSSLL